MLDENIMNQLMNIKQALIKKGKISEEEFPVFSNYPHNFRVWKCWSKMLLDIEIYTLMQEMR